MFELVDFVVVAILISGGMAGAKNGFFKQSVVLFGTILCFLLAWGLKDSLAKKLLIFICECLQCL